METRNPKDLSPHPISVQLYGENHIDDILESIKEFGILTPLTINTDNKIISGHRRWRSALELELETVPVEVKVYENEITEKRAILEFNRQREKTFSQKMNEAELLKEIESKLAEQRMKDPRRLVAKGRTSEIVGQQVGIGKRDTFERAEKVWHKAQEGNPIAKELIIKLDKGEESIKGAYTELFDKAHVSHNTGESEWYTPKPYIEAARATMGTIDLDPASSDIANKIIQATKYFTSEDDGRKQLWAGNVWMNPPYSQPLISEFCDILARTYRDKDINQACVLVNNATETNFYQNLLNTCNAVCFIKGRVKFIDKDGKESGAPLQGQTILYFGPDRDRFTDNFSKFGVILYAL